MLLLKQNPQMLSHQVTIHSRITTYDQNLKTCSSLSRFFLTDTNLELKQNLLNGISRNLENISKLYSPTILELPNSSERSVSF